MQVHRLLTNVNVAIGIEHTQEQLGSVPTALNELQLYWGLPHIHEGRLKESTPFLGLEITINCAVIVQIYNWKTKNSEPWSLMLILS